MTEIGLNSYMYDYFRRSFYRADSQFGEFLVAERTPIIELNSSYGVSSLRNITDTTNSATITSANGEIVIQTGATANSYAHIDSAELGRYIPGYGAEIGVGFRLDALPTGEQVATWGGHDYTGDEGFYFGHDATGIYVARKRGGTETKVYQSSWNVDKLNGSGPSGVTLNPLNGNIYQIQFTWYGYGQIVFGVLAVVDKQQTFVPCHQLSGFGETSIQSPNLQVFAEVDNNATTSNLKAYIGGRQYSIIGKYVPKFRFTGQWRGSVATSTTVKPLVSFRRKTAFQDISIKLQGYDSIAATEPCVIEIRLDGTLTGASWITPTNHTAAETAVEADISATAISGGIVIWSQLVPAGSTGQKVAFGQERVDFDIPNTENLSLCARTVSGTGTIISALRITEEW